MSVDSFDPITVCRACNQPDVQCWCDPNRRCPACNGKGWDCYDDLCYARGECMHDGWCAYCEGTGGVLPERVLVVPDETAEAIREYAREHPSIQKARYRSEHPDEDPVTSACYPMAEAYYHANDCELEVYCLSWSDVDADLDGTHWYLREPDGDRRWIDLGLPLMPPIDLPPFEEGTHRGWITGDNPSKRTRKILGAIDDLTSEKI